MAEDESLTGWKGADTGAFKSTAEPKVSVPALNLAQKSENYDALAFSCAIDLENAAISMNDEIDAMLQRSRYLVNKQETRNLKLMHRFKRTEQDLDKEIRGIEAALDEQEDSLLLEDRSRAKSSRGLAHIQTLLETAPSLARRGGGTSKGKKGKGRTKARENGKTLTLSPASTVVPSLSTTGKAHAVLTGAEGGPGAQQSGKNIATKGKRKRKKKKKKTNGTGKKLSPIVARVHASEKFVTCFEERDQLFAALEVGRIGCEELRPSSVLDQTYNTFHRSRFIFISGGAKAGKRSRAGRLISAPRVHR